MDKPSGKLLDSVLGAHPTFRAFPHLFRPLEVKKPGSSKTHTLVLSTAGVFLLGQKALQSSYHIVRTIPLQKLRAVKVDGTNLRFSSADTEIHVLHRQSARCAAFQYTIFSTLFDHPTLKCLVTIPPGQQSAFDEGLDGQGFPHLFVPDRFLASVLSATTAPLDEHGLISVYEALKKVGSRAEFTARSSASTIAGAVVDAFALGREATELFLNGIKLGDFYRHLRRLVELSQSIKKVQFRSVKFEPIPSGVENLFMRPCLIPLTEFEFINCDFSVPSAFFNAFSRYERPIRALSFANCNFCDRTLDSLFQSLFFSQCFHTLEHFSLSGVAQAPTVTSLLCQLVTSTWVLESHCLKTLCVADCGLDLGVLLPLLLQVNTGIETLDLSGNLLNKSLKSQAFKSFQSVVNLSFARCKFEGGSLTSLFRCLAVPTKGLIRVNLSDVTTDDWSELPTFEIPALIGLLWEDLVIDGTNSDSLLRFILKQPQLRELSLSRSLVAASIGFLSELCHCRNLTHLSVACERRCSLGKAIVAPLVEVAKNAALEVLDISGQEIGEDGLNQILAAASALKELRIRSFGPTSADALANVCERVLAIGSLHFATFPALDVKPALAKSPAPQRPDLVRVIARLRARFVEKFGADADVDEDGEQTKFPAAAMSSTQAGAAGEPAKPMTTIGQNIETMKCFTSYDAETMGFLAECGAVTGTDPMSRAYEMANAMTEIPQLARIFEQEA